MIHLLFFCEVITYSQMIHLNSGLPTLSSHCPPALPKALWQTLGTLTRGPVNFLKDQPAQEVSTGHPGRNTNPTTCLHDP